MQKPSSRQRAGVVAGVRRRGAEPVRSAEQVRLAPGAARRSHKGFGSGRALPDPRFEELTRAPRTAGKQRPGRESPRVRDSGVSRRRWSPWERQRHLLMDRW